MALYQSGSGLGALVGVGTTNPTSNLQVYGTPIAAGNVFSVLNTAASGNVAQFSSSTGTALIINANGNVGIGTTNPTSNLQVVGNVLSGNVISSVAMYGVLAGANTIAASSLTLTNALGTTYGGTGLTSFTSGGLLYASSTSALASSGAYTAGQILYGGGAGAAPASSSGLFYDSANSRLGIGTTSPRCTLDVVGSGITEGIYAKRFYLSAPGDNTDSSGSLNDGGPWYGLGYSVDTGLTSYIQLASFYGLALKTGGSPILMIGGNVGIGTTNPGALLDVQGGSIRVHNPGTTTSTIEFKRSSDGWNPVTIQQQYNTGGYGGDLAFQLHPADNISGTAPVTVMYLKAGGNVGIGSASPGYLLDVAGSMRLNGNYTYIGGNGGYASTSWAFDHIDTGSTFKSILFGYANSGGNAAEIGFNYVSSGSGSNYVGIGFYGSRPLNVTYGGYVGIGVTNPIRHFHMIGEASFTGVNTSMYFNLSDSAGNNGGNYTAIFRGLGSAGSAQVSMAGFNVLAGAAYFSGNMGVQSITSLYTLQVGGNSGIIGTTTIHLANSYLDASGNYGVRLTGVDNGVNGHNFYVQTRSSAGGAFVNSLAVVAGGSVGIGRTDPGYTLDVSGTIRATADIIAYSDKRVKTDLEPIENALDKVSKITGYTFRRIDHEDTEKRHAGVIAQEVLEVLPEVVYKDDTDKYNVAYGNLTALLIQAIKEERKAREAVTCELRSLEERIKLLEQK